MDSKMSLEGLIAFAKKEYNLELKIEDGKLPYTFEDLFGDLVVEDERGQYTSVKDYCARKING